MATLPHTSAGFGRISKESRPSPYAALRAATTAPGYGFAATPPTRHRRPRAAFGPLVLGAIGAALTAAVLVVVIDRLRPSPGTGEPLVHAYVPAGAVGEEIERLRRSALAQLHRRGHAPTPAERARPGRDPL